MSGDNILYSFGTIESTQTLINQFVAQMNEHLNQVDSKFKTLLADGWTGSGANAFQAKSQQWHTSADQMAQTLQQLASAVGNASVNMQQADHAAATRFG